MGEIQHALEEFFQSEDWAYTQVEGNPILRLSFRGKNGNWNCFAQAREEKHLFLFYSVCPINVPEMKRSQAAEFLTRANYGLPLGSFEMDYTDGEVRFKTSVDVEGIDLSPLMINHLVYTNIGTFDRYLPGIMVVIYGNASPEEAIQQIEAG